MAEAPLSVSALTARIHAELGDFGQVTVIGELAEVKVAQSGHLYATLKDAGARLSLVCWRSTVVRLGALPKEGERVVVRGRLEVYAPRGNYSLVATAVQREGAGDLARRFEELKARLLAEGLFAPERKRPLPSLPRAVGLVTADGSAALADFCEGLFRRFPGLPVVFAPASVQGPGAAAGLVAALHRVVAVPEVDVVLIGRGGGSLEDLWAFNEEILVRAVAGCPVPVISAVGHETDTVLTDFAADLRAKTPTAAAELAVPRRSDWELRLDEAASALDDAMDDLLASALARLEAAERHRALAHPALRLGAVAEQLDHARRRLQTAVGLRVQAAQHRLQSQEASLRVRHPASRLQHLAASLGERAQRLLAAAPRRLLQVEEGFQARCRQLDALSPLAVLGRGYAVLQDAADGRVVQRIDQAPPGTLLMARLREGYLTARVEGSRAERVRDASGFYSAEAGPGPAEG